MRNKKKNLVPILILLLLGISLGYALLSQDLNISGTSKIKGNTWDIHFDNVVVNSESVTLSTGDSAAEIDSNDNTLVNYTVTLNIPGDFYEFTVDVVNEGTIDGMVDVVSSKLNNTEISSENPLPSYLRYSVRYVDGVEIAPNHLLAVGETKTYKVRIEFKRDIEDDELPETLQTNTFSFSVRYVQADNHAVEVPLPSTTIRRVGYVTDPDGVNYDYFSNPSDFQSNDYINLIKTITLGEEIDPPDNIVESWDISINHDGKVMAYLTVNASNNTMYDLYIQGDGSLYANPDSGYLFYGLRGVDVINNLEALNIVNVTNMSHMFAETGYNSPVFTLDLGDHFDTSNVTNMTAMFYSTGYSSTVFTLDLGDKFDTSNVVAVCSVDPYYEWDEGMFYSTGYSSTVFTLDLGELFDTSKANYMGSMFHLTGYSSTVFTLDLGDKFDTSQVTNMQDMFHSTGYNSPVFTLDLGDEFDTSNVTDMSNMFQQAGYNSLVLTLDLGDKFDTSKVTDMGCMFYALGYSSPVFTLDLGDKFDTSQSGFVWGMFASTGYGNPGFTLDLGDKFYIKDGAMYNSGTTNIFSNWRSTNKIWVKDAATQSWILSHKDNSAALSTSNVLIKGA